MCVINVAAVTGRNVSVRQLEMRAETCVGRLIKCLVVILIRFLIRCLNTPILGLKPIKIYSSVPEFPRADRQTDIEKV
jgi:hypothetical protein